MSFTLPIPRADSRTLRFSVTVDGAPLDLTGYTITLSVKAKTSDAAPLFTETGALEAGNKSALVTIQGAHSDVTPGTYAAAITASKNGSPGPYTAIGTIPIVAHA